MSPTCFDSETIFYAIASAADSGLYEPELCVKLLTGLLHKTWSFLISDGGRYFFASLATLRALIFYLRRSLMPEARQLADVLITALFLLVLAAAAESQSVINHAVQCRGSQPVALGEKPLHARGTAPESLPYGAADDKG
ncbi:MAG: hypothetical protein ACLPWS_06280 [Rhodomicrobium sp.]